jgi:hypothetical protein
MKMVNQMFSVVIKDCALELSLPLLASYALLKTTKDHVAYTPVSMINLQRYLDYDLQLSLTNRRIGGTSQRYCGGY